ncbi:MAG: hypothetical protein JXA13_15500 [Anaerolineales bacterium]|nr:hypothetical protein [Anaerolineales bacterium]
MRFKRELIYQLIKAGEIEEASKALGYLLRGNPDNAQAWELLAALSNDPDRQASCCRQILRTDPENILAIARLLAINAQALPASDPALVCPQCGNLTLVHSNPAGLQKRPNYSCCGAELELPGSYQPSSTTSVGVRKRVVSKTEEDRGGIQPEAGFSRARQGDHSQGTGREKVQQQGGFLKRLFSRKEKPQPESQPALLTPAEILDLAGGGLSPLESRTCSNPQCKATIARELTKCPWCSQTQIIEPD